MNNDVPQLAEFLAQHARQPFCFRCLTASLALSSERLREALTQLGSGIALYYVVGRCSACDRTKFVYRLESSDGILPADDVRRLLLELGLAYVCRTCVSAQTGLSFGTVDKAMAELTMALHLHRTLASCAVCDRPRFVYGRNAVRFHNRRTSRGRPLCVVCDRVFGFGERPACAGGALLHQECVTPQTGLAQA